MAYTENGTDVQHTSSYDEMKRVYEAADLLVMHNGVQHDMVVFNRILGIPMDYRKWWDSLAVSFYLFPDRKSHGLEAIGVEHGVKKPKIDNWEDLSYEEYAHRCSEDVKINYLEWLKQKNRLEEIYET